MVVAPSFSQPYFCIQPPLQSPPKIISSTSVNFYLTFPPLLFNKIILKIHTNTSFLYTVAFFHLAIISAQPSQQSTPKRFSLSQPFSQFRLRQKTAELWCLVRIFNLFLFLDSDNNAHTHCLLIAQTHKMIILHSVVSDDDVCNWNSKPSNPPSLTPSTYCYYFHILLIPSQELTFLNLFKLIFILILPFSYSIYAPLHW